MEPVIQKKKRKMWRKPGTDVTWSLRKVDALRRRCEARDIEFDLSAAHLRELLEQQERRCAVTGRLLNYSPDPTPDSGSIIRIDSARGFVDGNVRWVTQQTNEALGSGSLHTLREFCIDVLAKDRAPDVCFTRLCGRNTE